MDIPGLGAVEQDEGTGWWLSGERPIAMLGGARCCIVVEGYDEDDSKQDFHRAIANFLAADEAVLKAASSAVFAYYKDMLAYTSSPGDEAYVPIASPDDVWSHVQFGYEPIVSRYHHGDKRVYISLECNCDWEPEHGLQIVFRDGNRVCKVGPYDGHLTNGDTSGDGSADEVIYRHL